MHVGLRRGYKVRKAGPRRDYYLVCSSLYFSFIHSYVGQDCVYVIKYNSFLSPSYGYRTPPPQHSGKTIHDHMGLEKPAPVACSVTRDRKHT